MKLQGLIEQLEYKVLQGDTAVNIKTIHHNSKEVLKDSLFVCLEGEKLDGNTYIKEAIENGAIAVITEKEIQVEDSEFPVLKVNDSRKALAYVASKYYNYPANRFNLVGVTGSRRKTLTSILIDKLLRANGKKTGVINGYGTRIENNKIQTKKIFLDPLKLHEIFYDMAEANVNNVVMEVQASDLSMKRMAGADFDIAVFTLLTDQRVSVFDTREKHREAKLQLFKMARNAVINIDSEDGVYLIENSIQEKLLTYGCDNEDADLLARNIEVLEGITTFDVHYKEDLYPIKVYAAHKDIVYAVLAAFGVAMELGVSIERIVDVTSNEKLFENDPELMGIVGEA